MKNKQNFSATKQIFQSYYIFEKYLQPNAQTVFFRQDGDTKLNKFIAEKLWRLDVSKAIEQNVNTENHTIQKGLNMRHSKADIRFF